MPAPYADARTALIRRGVSPAAKTRLRFLSTIGLGRVLSGEKPLEVQEATIQQAKAILHRELIADFMPN